MRVGDGFERALAGAVVGNDVVDPGPVDEDAGRWLATIEQCAALGHRFSVRTTDPALGRYLRRILAGLVAADSHGAATTYSFVTDGPAPWPYALLVGNRRMVIAPDGAYVLDYLLWHINRQAVERTPEHVLLHAGGVERDGHAGILAAPMESGKTTLTAALLQRGYRYLTDEAVAIEPETRRIQPFAKALSIDPGSWEVLADLEPVLEPGAREYVANQWHVPPTAIFPGALAEPSLPRVLILPRYERGAASSLVPVPKAQMLVELASLTFDFRARGRRNLAALGAVVSRGDCYRLVVGDDLERACDLVDDAFTRIVI
jgi:hypothetical protein